MSRSVADAVARFARRSAARGSARPPAPETLEGFLDRLAAGTPAPGGGAAAAIAAALAAALVGMVVRVIARREGERGIATIAEAADRDRQEGLALAAADAEAYRDVVAARRLSGPERGAALPRALARATETPVRLARLSHDVLLLCQALRPRAVQSVRSDLAVAASLASAALEGAVATARANLSEVGDGSLRDNVGDELERLSVSAARVRQGIEEVPGDRG